MIFCSTVERSHQARLRNAHPQSVICGRKEKYTDCGCGRKVQAVVPEGTDGFRPEIG
jgi:hypothetical protein